MFIYYLNLLKGLFSSLFSKTGILELNSFVIIFFVISVKCFSASKWDISIKDIPLKFALIAVLCFNSEDIRISQPSFIALSIKENPLPDTTAIFFIFLFNLPQ